MENRCFPTPDSKALTLLAKPVKIRPTNSVGLLECTETYSRGFTRYAGGRHARVQWQQSPRWPIANAMLSLTQGSIPGSSFWKRGQLIDADLIVRQQKDAHAPAADRHGP